MVKLTTGILKTLNNAKYAKRIRRVVEPYVAKDADQAYYYARDVLNGPFPEGEEAIATSAVQSYYYARFRLKGRFPAGEKAILKDRMYHLAPDYLHYVLLSMCGLSMEEAEKIMNEARNG